MTRRGDISVAVQSVTDVIGILPVHTGKGESPEALGRRDIENWRAFLRRENHERERQQEQNNPLHFR